tara:strand:+ start:716 stop:3034 length:2319 start_codon:yes stop_codon:yes gene_type:complete
MKKYIFTLTLISTCFLSQAQECISGNCYDSFGRILYDNGQEYIGEFKNGDPHGYGKTLYSNGDVYIGEYNNGTKHGYGVFKWRNGNTFYGKFKNGKEDGYAVKVEKRSSSIDKKRFLINEWEDGELKKSSVNQIYRKEDDKMGCIIGKCDHDSKTGIHSKGGLTRIGNLNQSVVFYIYGQLKIYIGEFNGQDKLQKGLITSGNSSSSLEIVNKRSGTWTSYYADSKKKIYIRTWIDDNMIEEVPINDVNTKISAPPSLIVDNIEFNDFNSNNLLEANEQATISFNIKNIGKGSAYGISVQIDDANNIQGLSYGRNKQINILKPQSVNIITIPLSASMSLAKGESVFSITISEGNGFDLDPIKLSIPTQSFIPPNLEIVDFVFISDIGEMKLGEKVKLQFAIQNIGQGIAENIQIRMIIPANVFAADETNYSINKLNPGEKKLYNFSFFTNKRFSADALNITAKLSEKYDKYAKDKIMSVKMEEDISNAVALKVESNISIENINIDRFSLTSHVDKNIPINKKVNNRFALVIGNEDYVTYQSDLKNEQNVDYAERDATIFKQYCLKTLGVKSENMFSITNATSGMMNQEIKKVIKLTELEGRDAELIIYYAGHGFPDEQKVPHLIPVDVSGSDLSRAINLQELYKDLGNLKAKKVTVFLDACFTGAGRESGLMASRGVKVKPREGSLVGSLVVFSASSGDQSSLPFNKENHGVFTYHLLKALQDAEGDISYGKLYDAINIEVNKTTLRNQAMEQTPKVNTSLKVVNDWRNWKF